MTHDHLSADEEALQQAEARTASYRRFYDLAPDMFAIIDAKTGRVLDCNRALATCTGYSRQEIVGRNVFELYHPDYVEQARDVSKEFVKSGVVHDVELPLGHRDGHSIDASISVSTGSLDADGKVAESILIIRDISHRKSVEAALKTSEARYQDLYHNAPDMFASLDCVSRRIVQCNQRLVRETGLASDRLIGQPIFELFAAESRDLVRDALDVVDETRDVRDVELQLLRQDGLRADVSMHAATITDEQDRTYFRITLRDITGRKRADAELLKRAAELKQAKEAAETANRAKSEFLANVSHEVRTPLNGVIGTAELLGHTTLTRAQRDHLAVIGESAEALLAILNDILDYSKIEAGKLDLEQRSLHLRDDLGTVLKSVASRLGEKDLELVGDVSSDVPDTVVGDPSRLQQVLFNLVGNAIKFTDVGEVVVRVRQQESTDEGVTLCFEVSDTGIGIPQNKQDAIFREFVQADASTTRRYGGTGLGLTIASRLIRAMGGEISLSSEVGKGSTFRFTIRVGLGTVADGEPPAHTRALTGLRTLVVDDNATNRRILADMVRSWGLRVQTVADVAAAINELRRATHDGDPVRLLLSDVQMPDADGFDLAAALKRDPTLGNPVTILLTSGGYAGDDARIEEANVAASLVKPVRHSELLETIQSVMGAALAPERASIVPESTVRLAPLHVLVAEDSLANQRLAVGMLEKDGHTVTVTSTGAEAVDVFTAGTFDVILMDLQMPEMDGFEALRAIRRGEHETGTSPIPIVALTARATRRDEEHCMAAGFDGYLTKPFRSRQLVEAIAASLPSTHTSRGVRAEAGLGVAGLDWERALASVDGDRQLLAKVIEGFLGQEPSLVAELRAALSTLDLSVIQRVAHTIGGSLRLFEGSRIVERAGLLEETCRAGSSDRVDQEWRDLDAELKVVVSELRRFVDGLR